MFRAGCQKFGSRARVISDFGLKTDFGILKIGFVAISLITRARALCFSEWVRHEVFCSPFDLACSGPSTTPEIAISSKKLLKMGLHLQKQARASACTRVARAPKCFSGPPSICLFPCQILFQSEFYLWRYAKNQSN